MGAMLLIILLNLVVIVAVMYVGTQGHEESDFRAADSRAVAAWSAKAGLVSAQLSHDTPTSTSHGE